VTSSTHETTCGDGIWVEPQEGCDDANTIGFDGCTTVCTKNLGFTHTRSGDLTISTPICGDIYKVQGEVCDDGSLVPLKGCLNDCSGTKDCWECTSSGSTTIVDTCIDVCNDNNALTVPADGFKCLDQGGTFACIGHCPDGKVVGNEVCDDGTGTGCLPDCSGAKLGFTCTVGNLTAASVCSSICGDGI
jgi:cysteine-rich repeat protein